MTNTFEWLHYAEGSAFFPISIQFLADWLHIENPTLAASFAQRHADQMRYIDARLGDRLFLVGDSLTGADIQITFVLEFAESRGAMDDWPRLKAYLQRMEARPAYARAIDKGGAYTLSTLLDATKS